MYLPTFWKLCMENRMHSMKHTAPWAASALLMATWLSYHSLYNWIFTSVIPPERGVKKRVIGK